MKKTIILIVLLMTFGGLFATALSEGFENVTFPPPGWAVVNGGDGRTWQRTYMENAGHTGYGCATIDTSNLYAHDDWLITPQLTPMSGSSTFSFWARNGPYFTDRFNVMLSTFTTNTTDFNVTLASNVGPSSAWTLYTYNLSAYAGQKVFIGIQAISVNQGALLLDDFSGPAMSSYEGFETNNFNTYNWINNSSSPWTIDSSDLYAGTYAAKSGVIADGAGTSLTITQTVSIAGKICFSERISSEQDGDYLKFYIDDVEQDSWSGPGIWYSRSYPVSSGLHTFRWTYSKNGSGVGGSDCAWIDHIVFPPTILGTDTTPFLITTPAELNNVRNNLGSATVCKKFKLMNDIDMLSYLSSGGAGYAMWGGNGWLPIGDGSNNFYGNFDGNNHTITNLRTWYYGTYHGLFGVTGVGSTVKNLLLGSNCAFLGDADTGSIIGHNKGTVQNCRSAASVSIGNATTGGGVVGNNLGTMTGCGFTGTITRSGGGVSCNSIGGIAGRNETGAVINDSYSTGSVTGNTWCGGLVGWNNGTINRCFTSGTINGAANSIGGLVGQHSGTITNSYSRASVSGASYVGGLVGNNGGSAITNCYSTGTVSGSTRGGLIGSTGSGVTSSYWDTQTSGLASSYGGTGMTTAQMKVQSNFTGWDFAGETTNGTNNYWNITTSDNNGYPFLYWEHASELRIPVLTYPADYASGLPRSGFNLTWSANLAGQAPHHYSLFLVLGNAAEIFNSGYANQHTYANLTSTSFNPVTQGGITFIYGQTWYWTVIGYTSAGVAFPTPSTRSFITEKDPFAIESFELGNTDGSTSISEWTQVLGSGTNYWTASNTDTGYNTTPRTGAFNVILNFAGGANTWMFRSVPLTAGTSYDVELYAHSFYPNLSYADIGIYYGTAATIADMTNTVVAQTNLPNAGYQRINSSFTPSATGTYYLGIRTVISGIATNFVSLDDVTINRTPPILSYTPTSINFNVTQPNVPTAFQDVTITNTGGQTLNLAASDISVVGTDPTQFSFTTLTGFPAALTAGQSVSIPVRFNPTNLGVKTASLRIIYNATVYDVPLTGTSQTANALLESFEGTFPPLGWTKDNNWQINNNPVYHGTKTAYRWTDSTPSFSLSTPELTLTGSSVLNFKTYVYTSTAQKMQLGYYNPTTSAWVNIGSAISIIPDSWQSHNVTLTGITGNYQLGFAPYYSAGGSGSWVYLDYVYGPEFSPPSAPPLSLPAADASEVSELPTFTWEAPTSGGILTGYRVFCDQNPNPTTQVTSSLLTGLSYTVTSVLNYSADYYWKVVAYGPSVDSTASTIRKFTTNPDPQIVVFPYLQDFSSMSFPPYGWANDAGFSWFRYPEWGYGGYNDPCIIAQFKDHPSEVIDLDTPVINFVGLQGKLTFAHAYASDSANPGNIDQLEIMYSTDGGSNFIHLVTYVGGENGTLNTAPAITGNFLPWAADWAFKSVELPMGTNKVRFRGISGNGNHLWMDNISFSYVHFAGGTGTASAPYLITNAADLDFVRSYTGLANAGKCFKLMNDIDLTSYLSPGGAGYIAWGSNGWLPIGGWLPNGDVSNVFYGTFDGNGYTISNLRSTSYANYRGLFGITGVGSTVKNLNMNSSCYILGNSDSGGIVGHNKGTVINCNSASTVNIGNATGGGGVVGNNLGTIRKSSFSGNITRSGTGVSCSKIGGVAGQNDTGAVIDSCYSTGSVTGNSWCGGLVGWNQGTINKCFTTGSITAAGNSIGGLVGEQRGTINNSYSRATVSGASYVGGLVGYNNSSTITNSYSTGTVAGSQKGGLSGQTGAAITSSYWDTQTSGIATSYGGTGRTTAEMKTQATFAGWDFTNIWFIDPSANNGYPQLAWTGIPVVTTTPTNITIQQGTDPETVIISWDNMSASWYGVYGGSSPSNLTYLGWSASNSITINAENMGFFKITSGTGTPTAPALLRGNYELRMKN